MITNNFVRFIVISFSQLQFVLLLFLTASYLVSCEEAKLLYPMQAQMSMYIDIDDSGPLEPFPVICVFQGKFYYAYQSSF